MFGLLLSKETPKSVASAVARYPLSFRSQMVIISLFTMLLISAIVFLALRGQQFETQAKSIREALEISKEKYLMTQTERVTATEKGKLSNSGPPTLANGPSSVGDGPHELVISAIEDQFKSTDISVFEGDWENFRTLTQLNFDCSLPATKPSSINEYRCADGGHLFTMPIQADPNGLIANTTASKKVAKQTPGSADNQPTSKSPEAVIAWTFQPRQYFDPTLLHALTLPILALIFTGTLIISSFASKTLNRALKLISQRTNEIAEGKWEGELATSNFKEIDSLISTINAMFSSIRQRDKAIRKSVYSDKLTGLPNRAYLLLTLRERIDASLEPLSLITWSVDNIDTINEVLGHDVADQVLVGISKKVRRMVPDHVLIARLEGSMFCLVVPRSKGNSIISNQNFRRLTQGSVRVKTYDLDVVCRCGVSHFPDHGSSPEHLLRRAEIALQLARRNGMPFVEFEPRMEERSAARLALIAQLKKAIQEQEFCLFFQPKLNLRTNTITQAETLIRWNHPQKGIMAPGGFIELAEQTGLVRDITRFVLSSVFEIAPLCKERQIRISMNLSAVDLEDQSLLKFVKELHRRNPDASGQIIFEITESSAMRDPEYARQLLEEFSTLGFHIAVDDFGAGYSSLAYLKRFPVSELKIDRSLVQGADQDLEGQIILESTIGMGHIMGLVVTTEGVETDSEYALVKSLGADFIQGYWLAKPMPYEEFKFKHLSGNYDQLTHPA